jgi:ABC-2 type transport system permease protein
VRRRAGIRFGPRLVFWREVGWFRRRPFLLALTTLAPLALMGLLTWVFSAGLATELPIGALDLDGSTLSREILRTVDSAPDARIAVRVADLAEGRELIRSGRIYGLLMLPRNLERDAFAGRRPEVVFFYNTQILTTGNLVLRGVSGAVTAAGAGVRLALRTSQAQPLDFAQASLSPIPVQTHPLFNPTLNYAHFLLAALLPTILQIVVVTASAYSIGLDVEGPHRLAVLRRLGGGLWPAMVGKLLPSTLAFLAVFGVMDAVLFRVLELPLRGSAAMLVLSGFLFVLACQLIGAVLALFLRPTAMAVSIATLLMSPSFGFMGIGFPRHGMNAFAFAYGSLLPGTWYLTARIDQTIRGTPPDLSWRPIAILLAMVIALALVAALRLVAIRRARRIRSHLLPAVEAAA